MQIIPREAKKITYSTEIRNLKKRLTLNGEQKALVVGSMLGDGHLEANWSKTNYRLKIGHSIKQKEYVYWKYNILKEWVLTEPKIHQTTNSLRFSTISHSELTYFYNMFYNGRIKIIPENLFSFVSSLAIAIWFMDDGNIVKQKGKVCGYHINSQSFSYQENERLLKMFHENYSVKGVIERNKNKFRLGIFRKESRLNFIDIIQPYILPSMRYKIG